MKEKKENKDIRINIRMSSAERDVFHQFCKERKSTISEEIRKFIQEQCENKNANNQNI